MRSRPTRCGRCGSCGWPASWRSSPTRRRRAGRAPRRGGPAHVAVERIYGELRRVLASDRAGGGHPPGARARLVRRRAPELEALRGCEQSRYHHLDVARAHARDPRAGGRARARPGAGARRRARRRDPRAARRAARRRDDPRRRCCASRRCCTTSPSRRRATVDADGRIALSRARHARRGDGARDPRPPARRRARPRAGRGDDAPPPAARLPRRTTRRSRGARSTATSTPATVSPRTSRCCRWPTAWQRAATAPRSRSHVTSSWRARSSARRCAGSSTAARRRSCAATSSSPRSGSSPDRSSASCSRRSRPRPSPATIASAPQAIAFAAARIA